MNIEQVFGLVAGIAVLIWGLREVYLERRANTRYREHFEAPPPKDNYQRMQQHDQVLKRLKQSAQQYLDHMSTVTAERIQVQVEVAERAGGYINVPKTADAILACKQLHVPMRDDAATT